MDDLLNYKGYYAKVEFSKEDKVLFGKIEGINDLVTFESTNAETIEDEFHAAVDDYLDYCNRIGKIPDKTYSGSFNIRISPELHKQLAIDAIKHQTTLNKTVETAIVEYLHNDIKSKVNTLWDTYSFCAGYVNGFAKASDSHMITNWSGGNYSYAG